MTTTEDELEIRNVLARVAHITDGRGTLEEYLTLWTEDSTWESPVSGSFKGHQGHLDRHAKYRATGVQGPERLHRGTTRPADRNRERLTQGTAEQAQRG